MRLTLNTIIIIHIIMIIILLSLTGYYLFSPEPLNFPTESLQQENISLFILPSDNALEELFTVIEQAEFSIHCTFRSLNHLVLENLLFEKESQGVQVRLYVDHDYRGNSRIVKPFVRFSEHGYEMMHSNYCIIDDEVVLTGSTIFNQNTLHLNIHDSLIIHSKELAQQFESHFWTLYENHTRERPFSQQSTEVYSTNITPFFCPYDDCAAVYVNRINEAQNTIYFAVYAITHPDVIRALDEAQNRGVKIRGIVDRRGITPSSIYHHDLDDIHLGMIQRRVHTKLFVIDGQHTITGSLNPSIKGTVYNDEAILLIQNKEIAGFYEELVQYLFAYNRLMTT